MRFIKVYPSFVVLFVICSALGYIESFFLMFLAVTLHELGHVLAALMFGVKTEKIILTPLGEIAVLKELQFIHSYKKVLIFIAGPFVSFCLWIILFVFFKERYAFFMLANLTVLIFNILPIYPFDGGRIFHTLLGKHIGVINANYFLYRMSKVLSMVFCIAGVVQLVLFPLNFSLLCMGFYVLRINRREILYLNYELYHTLTTLNLKTKKIPIMQMKRIMVSKDTEIKSLLYKLCWDYYYEIHIFDTKGFICAITETDFMKYIINRNFSGSMEKVVMYVDKQIEF